MHEFLNSCHMRYRLIRMVLPQSDSCISENKGRHKRQVSEHMQKGSHHRFAFIDTDLFSLAVVNLSTAGISMTNYTRNLLVL